jgi:hypothetical protein
VLPVTSSADSNHGVEGVCNVVSMGVSNVKAAYDNKDSEDHRPSSGQLGLTDAEVSYCRQVIDDSIPWKGRAGQGR